jgi:hypothetical protein
VRSAKPEKPPRHWVPDALWSVHAEALSMAARVVYVALCRCVTKGEARPSVAWLGRMVAAHRTTVLAALAELETAGMVVTTRRFGAANRYVLSPVEQWKVPVTSRSQRPVADQSPAATGRLESPNRSAAESKPVVQSDTFGSTAVSTAGSEAVAVARSKQAEGTGDLRRLIAELQQREPGSPALEIRQKAERELARQQAESFPELLNTTGRNGQVR